MQMPFYTGIGVSHLKGAKGEFLKGLVKTEGLSLFVTINRFIDKYREHITIFLASKF